MLLVFGIFRALYVDEETRIVRCLQTSVLMRPPCSMRQATHSARHPANNGQSARFITTARQMLNAGAVLMALPPVLREHEAAREPGKPEHSLGGQAYFLWLSRIHMALLPHAFSTEKITSPPCIARLQSRLSEAAFSIAQKESATQMRKKSAFPL
jgi:hypothetical protein